MHSTRILSRLNGKLAFVIVGEAWLVYVFLSAFAPTAQTFGLAWWQLRLVQLTVSVPVLIIWLVAAYGAVRFKDYTVMIRGSKDGAALSRITDGLLIIVGSTILQSFLNLLQRYAVGTPLLEPMVFLDNHIPVVLSLIALGYIFSGSAKLSRIVDKPISARQMLTVLVPFTVTAALFAVFYYTNVTYSVTNGVPNYVVPGKTPFFTVALPYLVVWLLAALSLLNIANYIINVKGPIYKAALRRLAWGIVAVVTFTVLTQLLTVTAGVWQGLSLSAILLVVYALLIAYSVGFILIAWGARRLVRIEAAV
jgi:hypothetical protein